MSNNNMNISGSGTMASGNYGNVRISGSGRINGDVTCEELCCSGSGRAEGVITCTGLMKCSGSFHSSDMVVAGTLSCSGSFHGDGRVEVGNAILSGTAKLGGGISATDINASGSVSAADMEAEHIVVSGGCNVPGLMNAESIEINLGGGCRVGSIGCGRLLVKAEFFGHTFFVHSPRCFNRLDVGTIEGDELLLENTTAEVVRGRDVTVGPNCRISLIEYSGTLTVDPTSQVREQIRR